MERDGACGRTRTRNAASEARGYIQFHYAGEMVGPSTAPTRGARRDTGMPTLREAQDSASARRPVSVRASAVPGGTRPWKLARDPGLEPGLRGIRNAFDFPVAESREGAGWPEIQQLSVTTRALLEFAHRVVSLPVLVWRGPPGPFLYSSLLGRR